MKMKMLKTLIVLIVAIVIGIVGLSEPSYAYTNDYNNLSISHHQNLTEGDNVNSVASEETTEEPSKVFVTGVMNGAITTAGVAVGGALICLTLDGIASAFFPPAASLSIFCPAVGAASGGAKVVLRAR